MPEKKSDTPAQDAPEKGGEEDALEKPMPKGRRMVRKRRKKRGGAGESRQKLFLKKREILREMHEDTGAVGVKEQIERLKTAHKAKQNEQPLEEFWGGPRTKHRGMRWLLLRAFAIVIPVLAIVTAFLLTRGEDRSALPAVDDELELDKSEPEEILRPFDPTGPIAWINEDPHGSYRSAISILESLNQVEPGGLPPTGLLRDEERALGHIASEGLGWSSDFFTRDPRDLFWSMGESDQTGFLVVEGRRANHEKFRAYYVRTPEGLRLDWEASAGWCEVPFERLLRDPPPGPVLVRGIMLKEAHFDVLHGPGSLLSWYLLRNPDESEHLWAYAPAGSSVDRELLDLFRFGWVIMDRRESVRVTVRLSKPKGDFRANEFIIEEVVSEEWVIPGTKEQPVR